MPPSRQIIIDKLHELIAGGADERAEISSWAEREMLSSEDDDITDLEAWSVLKILTGADAPSTDRDWLYYREDFEDWLARLTG